MDKETGLYDVSMVKKKLIASTLDEVFKALKERGYNPVNQIVGYLISGDPGYISNYKDSREKIMDFDRSEVVAIILEEYLEKNEMFRS
jgi:uncharacterized protein (UPF0297 family)